jgi:hypothetical protein
MCRLDSLLLSEPKLAVLLCGHPVKRAVEIGIEIVSRLWGYKVALRILGLGKL